MAIVKKKQLKQMSKTELNAKLADVESETKRAYATRDKNTAKKTQLRRLKSRILNYVRTAK